LSSVVFVGGCNLRCSFCHSAELVNKTAAEINEEAIPHDLLFEELSKNTWTNGIVITGGEPTLRQDIGKFCRKLRELGKEIRVATNGVNAGLLGALVADKLVDSVALDIKTSFEPEDGYDKLVGAPSSIRVSQCVRKSLTRILEHAKDVELRTTVIYHPDGPYRIHSKRTLKNIAHYLADIRATAPWVLQPFRPGDCLTESMNLQPPTPLALLLEWLPDLKKIYPYCQVRGVF